MNSDERLMTRCAERLTGKAVEVRLRHPTAEHGVGQVYKTWSGFIIDIDPNFVDDDATLQTLLHECAHIKNGDLALLPVSADHRAAPGSVRRSETERKIWRASAPEHSADVLADKWMAYAEKHWSEYDRPNYTRFGRMLLSLINSRGV